MIAFTPALINNSGPSEKGKKASDAATEPIGVDCVFSRSGSIALATAILQASFRSCWPTPDAIKARFLTRQTALDLQIFAAFQANKRSSACFLVGFFFVTTFKFRLGISFVSES